MGMLGGLFRVAVLVVFERFSGLAFVLGLLALAAAVTGQHGFVPLFAGLLTGVVVFAVCVCDTRGC